MDKRSKYLRSLVIRALEGGGRGHIGSSMSLIEILQVLYDNHIKFKASDPNWSGRDRVILSKGHGCLALYAVLADKDFFEVSKLDSFCSFNSILGGHPDVHKIPGVEASTGALGHGLSIGVGMAIAAKINREKHGIYVIMGDGEINEGSVWEAALSSAKHQLDNLTIVIDYNKLQSYGPTSEVLNLEPLADKWKAFGFSVAEVDGHDLNRLNEVFSGLPFETDKPSAIICHTIKGKGISFAEGVAGWHHKSGLTKVEIESLYKELDRL